MTTAPPRAAPRPAVVLAAIALVAMLASPILVRVFVLEAFRVPSPAMYPALYVGDSFLVDKTAGGRAPARGDVVVFAYPADPRKDFVGRVAGVAGDSVLVRDDGVVERNGAPLPRCELGPWTPRGDAAGGHPETFRAAVEWNGARAYVVLHQGGEREPASGNRCAAAPCVVPPGHVLTLGDNRDNSYDGRYWGFVPVANVRGRARWIHGPGGGEGRFRHDVNGPPAAPPPALRGALDACLRRGPAAR